MREILFRGKRKDNDECPNRAYYCPYSIQEECEFYERDGLKNEEANK